MAPILHPWLLPLSILLFSSPSSSSSSSSSSSHQRRILQSSSPSPSLSPQNTETFFPSIPSPAFSNQSPPPPPPPPLLEPPKSGSSSSTPSNSNDRNKIIVTILATGATSFTLSFLIFYIFYRFSLKKHQHSSKIFNSKRSNSGHAQKGMIVDENGLDVLYWRNLIGSDSPNRCNYCNCKFDRSSQQSPTNPYDSYDRKIQKQPLLPTNSVSSSSHASEASSKSMQSGTRPAAPSLPPLPPPPGRAPSAPPPAPPVKAPPPPPPAPPPPPKAPPPPPPPMKKHTPTPPPPMPPRPPPSKSHAAAGPPLPPGGGGPPRPPLGPAAEGGRGRAKLKPLHWDKVTPPNIEHSMVWDRINDGSFRIDDDLMDTLFGYTSTNRNNPNSNKTSTNPFNSPSPSTSTPTQISLLDPRKSQNIAIVIRSLGISRKEILDALLNGQGLNTSALEKLSRISLTKEEETKILNFNNNPTALADAESFLCHLLKSVNSPFIRINAMLFKSNYDSEILHIKKSIETLELACKELKSHGLFLKLLEAILKAGNRMNAGTARGNAKAFNLSALCKLSDVKSTDGKTTLLHFVVEEVVRNEGKRLVINRNHSLRRSGSSSSNSHSGKLQANKTTREEKEKEYIKLGLPIVGGLSEELANVKKAAAIDHDALMSSCSSIGERISEIRAFLSKCNGGDGFLKEMKGFLEEAEEELKVVIEEQMRVMELVKRTTEYYQPGSSKDKNTQTLQLFVIVRDFFVMFDRVCVDITRHMQKKAPMSSRGSSPKAEAQTEKRPVARFPNLPPQFMSENSRSSSDSDSADGFN